MYTDVSQERLNAWKKAFAKSGIKYETDDEYKEAIFNLVGYFETLIEMDQQQKSAEAQKKAVKNKKL